MTDHDNQIWLKPSQVNQLREACYSGRFRPTFQDRNDALIATLYDAGLRPCELVELTTEMFDADDGVIRLPSDAQKQYPNENSPRPATIELAQDEYTTDTVRTLQSYLSNRWKDSLFMWPSAETDAMRTRQVRRTVKHAAIAADVRPYRGNAGRGSPEDVSPYALRHSVAYRILNACDDNRGIYDVRKRLRHSSVTMTEQHYDHFDWV